MHGDAVRKSDAEWDAYVETLAIMVAPMVKYALCTKTVCENHNLILQRDAVERKV